MSEAVVGERRYRPSKGAMKEFRIFGDIHPLATELGENMRSGQLCLVDGSGDYFAAYRLQDRVARALGGVAADHRTMLTTTPAAVTESEERYEVWVERR